jgi:hypothetical protein
MAKLFQDITVKVKRRQVAVRMPDGSERLGFFHKWSELKLPVSGTQDRALVEAPDGTITYVDAHCIRFLPIGDEISAEELETMYRENGILKG